MIKTREVFLQPGKIVAKERELPKIGTNEILVKTYQASVCGSERYYYRGILVRPEDEARHRYVPSKYRPAKRGSKEDVGEWSSMRPLGHEGGGTVVEVGSAVGEYVYHPGHPIQVGDRIGNLGGWPTYSDYGVVSNLMGIQPIPDEVPNEIGCLYEPFGCSGFAALHMGVMPGDIVSVNGSGFAGMTLVQGALKHGASMIIVIDIVDKKLEIARKLVSMFKAKFHSINPRKENCIDIINDLTDDEGTDVACDCVGGTGIGVKQALDQVKHNGILALYGDNYTQFPNFCFNRFHEDGLEIRTLNAMHYNELRSIMNCYEAYRAQVRGVFDELWPIVWENSQTYKLDQITEVFQKESEKLDQQSSVKTVIRP